MYHIIRIITVSSKPIFRYTHYINSKPWLRGALWSHHCSPSKACCMCPDTRHSIRWCLLTREIYGVGFTYCLVSSRSSPPTYLFSASTIDRGITAIAGKLPAVSRTGALINPSILSSLAREREVGRHAQYCPSSVSYRKSYRRERYD